MSDRPSSQNINYIRQVLSDECKQIEKKLGVRIYIDSDSRDEDGSKSIEENVLKKIAGCDLFIGDITPIYPRYSWLWWQKATPNPNVMYELGFAVSALGWNRCIMIWNSKYGDLGKAPFDIRNHSTVTYEKGRKDLSLYVVLKSKIEHYDELVRMWRMSKERSFDAEIYNKIISICSERNLLESIRKFLNNRIYNGLEFKWWDKLIYDYTHYPDNKFLDIELHDSYMSFLKELNKMLEVAIRYNEPSSSCYRDDLEVGSDEWELEQNYKIRDPFKTLEEHKAYELQDKIDNAFDSLCPSLLDSYMAFRDLVRKKLLI